MKQKNNNQVHLNGFVKNVEVVNFEDKNFFNVLVGTSETIPGKDPKYTTHMVKVNAEGELAEQLKGIAESKDEKHSISLDGHLVANEKDGKKFFYVSADAASVALDSKIQKGESRNTISIEGNVARLENYPEHGLAVASIAVKYWVPGESTNYKGETQPYTEKANFLEVRINQNRLPETYEQLTSGAIAVGDLIGIRGQMHNDTYEKDNKKVYSMKIDANKVEIIAKKGEKKNQAEETAQKTEKKTEKKAVAKKTEAKKGKKAKGMTM